LRSLILVALSLVAAVIIRALLPLAPELWIWLVVAVATLNLSLACVGMEALSICRTHGCGAREVATVVLSLLAISALGIALLLA